MKKIVLIVTFLVSSIFAYNYNGEWVNQSGASYNDPVKFVIKNGLVTPYIKRGHKVARLKTKKATNTGTGLFEAWGFRNKNLALYIKPINSYKLKVYAKKIDVNKRVIYTKTFIFKNKKRLTNKVIKNRYIGVWKNNSPFSAISKLRIIKRGNDLIVKAWRPVEGGQLYLGAAKARIKGNKLYLTWKRRNILVNATISGLKYDSVTNRYNQLKLYIRAKNLRTGLVSEQTIYLNRRGNRDSCVVPAVGRPVSKHYKVGPLDINVLINSY